MTESVSNLAFTPSSKTVQIRTSSPRHAAHVKKQDGWSETITQELQKFIAERDSFYLGTASAKGRPYIQHRGGPKGFLRVLDERTLAFADFSGNRQYISVGNLAENDQAFLFLMDYATQSRIKIWGKAEVIEDDRELLAKLSDPEYRGRPERVIRFHVEAWDINCRQHIPRRYSQDDVERLVQPLRDRVAFLEAENEMLKKQGPLPVNSSIMAGS